MKEEKLVIGFAGKLGSGKKICTEYFKEKCSGEKVVMSAIITDTLKSFFLPLTRENIAWLAMESRSHFGDDYLAKAMAEKIENLSSNVVIVDGIRRVSEVKFFKEKYGNDFVLAAVKCSDDIRLRRVGMREKEEKKGKDPLEGEVSKFLEREKSLPTEAEISLVEEMADFAVDNSRSRDELYHSLDKLMMELCQTSHNQAFSNSICPGLKAALSS